MKVLELMKESHYSSEKQMSTLGERLLLSEKFTEFLIFLRIITINYEYFRKTPLDTKK